MHAHVAYKTNIFWLFFREQETFINAMGERTVFGGYDTPLAQPYTHLCTNGTDSFTAYIVKAPRLLIDAPLFKPFLMSLDQGPGVVLVANWGPFYLPDDQLREGMRDFAMWVNTTLTNTTFIFRSANMAHFNCDEHLVPDNNWTLDAADEPEHPEWHWGHFPGQSQRVVRPELLKGQFYLDILPLSRKRPDAHPGQGDCLHYCLPGPMDTWVILLMALIQRVYSCGATTDYN